MTEIWYYSAHQWGPEQADRYLDKLKSSFQRLAEGIAPGYPCTRFDPDCSPEILYYKAEQHYVVFRFVSTEKIEVLTLVHTRSAQQLTKFLEELGSDD